MPKVSKESAAKVQDIGVGEVRVDVVDGYEVSFLDLREEATWQACSRGSPTTSAPAPTGGTSRRGRSHSPTSTTPRCSRPGDAFYVPPGHSPAASAGARGFVLFSPAEQVAEVNAVIQRNMAAMQSGLTDASHTGTGSSSARSPCWVAKSAAAARVDAPILA